MGPDCDVEIRGAAETDRGSIWEILHAVVDAGDTFAVDPRVTRGSALEWWFGPGVAPYVAVADGGIVGSYILRPNHAGPGAHIANGAYIVSPHARGRGVGYAMGAHSLAEARRLGYRAMQFNIVVSTNTSAVRLWQRLGFHIIGTTPGGFRHATLGEVDTHIMYRSLAGV